MSNVTDFWGGSGNPVGLVNSLEDLPRTEAAETNIKMKAALISLVPGNGASWASTWNNHGAATVVTTADTWHTVASVSGTGALTSLSPPYLGAAGTVEWEVTIDGVVDTFSYYKSVADNTKLIIGPVATGHNTSPSTTYREMAGIGGYYDYGWAETLIILIPSPWQVVNACLPRINFDSTLVVKIRHEGGVETTVDREYACVGYHLF